MREAILWLGAALVLSSCVTLRSGSEAKIEPVVTPPNFLNSDSPAMEEWLDSPFKLHYDEMELREVYATHPLNSMRYRFEGLPRNAEPFSMDLSAITRRQLLYSLSQMYSLATYLEYKNRVPYTIVVRHKPLPSSTDLYGSGLSSN